MCAVTASSRRDISCPFRLLVAPGAEVAVAPQRRLALCSSGTVEVAQVGHERQVLLAGEQAVDRGDWPMTPIASRTAPALAPRRGQRPGPRRHRRRSAWTACARQWFLPAPSGPNSARTVPSVTVRSMPPGTSLPPYELRSPVAVITGW